MDFSRLQMDVVVVVALLGLLNVLQTRVSFHFYILRGLRMWMPPSDEDLQKMAVSEAAKVVKKKTKTAQRAEKRKAAKQAAHENDDDNDDNDEKKEEPSLTINRTHPIPLRPRSLEKEDMVGEYSFYLRSIMIAAVGLSVVYSAHEVATLISGPEHWLSDGQGVSFWWSVGSNVFVVILMLAMQIEFLLQAKALHDVALTIMVAMVSAMVTIAVLLTHDNVFDFQLEAGFNDLGRHLAAQLRRLGHRPIRVSYATFTLIVAIVCGVLGFLLLFPTLRFVRTHVGAERARKTFTTKVLLASNVVLPLAACLSWVHLPLPQFIQSERDANQHGQSPTLFRIRLGLFYLCTAARIVTFRIHVQSFLDLAPERIGKLQRMPTNLKKWQRRRTWAADVKVPAHKVCGMVTQISTFVCGHCTYLILPIIFMLTLNVLLRTKGAVDLDNVDSDDAALSFESQIFYRAFLSFLCWWQCMYQALALFVGYIWFDRRKLFFFFYAFETD